MEFPFKKEISTLLELKELCEQISKIIEPGDTLALIGNLGTGKTTFTKYLCANWSIEEVDSPSFSLVNEYYGDRNVFHFDFYRIEKEEELYDLGFYEYINDTETIKIIEWADMFPDMLPAKRYEIHLTLQESGTRLIEIDKYE